jgi:hypothetical protein
MKVLNLTEISLQIESVMGSFTFGNHILHFEHSETADLRYVKVFVFCEKCDSEFDVLRSMSGLRYSLDPKTDFVEMFYSAWRGFMGSIPESCEEAMDLMSVKTVLEE